MSARRCIAFAALIISLSPPAWSADIDYSITMPLPNNTVYSLPNIVTIKPHGPSDELFKLSTNTEPVLVVKTDGTVLIRGVEVEKMNTEEAKEAWREVTLWVAQQYQHTSINSALFKQTDYLLQQLEECQRRCGK